MVKKVAKGGFKIAKRALGLALYVSMKVIGIKKSEEEQDQSDESGDSKSSRGEPAKVQDSDVDYYEPNIRENEMKVVGEVVVIKIYTFTVMLKKWRHMKKTMHKMFKSMCYPVDLISVFV